MKIINGAVVFEQVGFRYVKTGPSIIWLSRPMIRGRRKQSNQKGATESERRLETRRGSQGWPGGQASVPSALPGVGLGGFSSGTAMAQLRSIRSVTAA